MSAQDNNALVDVDGVDKVFHRGSEEIHVLSELHLKVPKGEFLACVAAGPAYKLLGKDDMGTDQMPALNSPIMHTIGYHYRSGKHEVTAFDWDQFLVFADMHLRSGK